MRKRTGTGGCGGRRLSPEYHAKLGSFGFKPRTETVRRSDGYVITKRSPYQESSKAEMIYKLSQPPQTSYNVRRNQLSQFNGQPNGQYLETDTLESNTDVIAPPNQLSSIDLGMSSADSSARLAGALDKTNGKSKKQVVLRRPKPSTTLFKSQQYLSSKQGHNFDHMRLVEEERTENSVYYQQ